MTIPVKDGAYGLKPLRPDQYRHVAEWEYGPQPDNIDWELHAREMEDPKFERYGLYLNGSFSGCISFERISRNVIGIHVATRRHTFKPDELAAALRRMAGYLFDQDWLAIVAHAPIEKHEVARLALRCNMFEYGHSHTTRFFMMTRKRFYADAKT